MKNRILFLASVLLASVTCFSQVTNKIQADSVRIYQVGGNPAELIIENSTKGVTNGFLQNSGNGRTKFALAIDSVWFNSGSLYFRRGSSTTSFAVRNGIDSIHISNDSLYEYVSGIAFFKGMISPGSVSGKLNISDTGSMLAPYLRKIDTTGKWIKSINASITGSALGISGVPITNPAGTIALGWLGTSSQYVKGNGSLGTFSTDMQTIGDARYAPLSHSHLFSDISNGTTAVRNLFSAGTGITYNSSTGVIAWDGSGSGISSLNSLTGTIQTLAIDTTYTGPASWSSVGTAHTLRLPARLFSGLTSIDTTNITNFSDKVRSLFSGTAPVTYSNGNIALDTNAGKWRSENYYKTIFQPIGNYLLSSSLADSLTKFGHNYDSATMYVLENAVDPTQADTIFVRKMTDSTDAGHYGTISNIDYGNFRKVSDAYKAGTISGTGAWGSITGSLNSQTDLRDSLRNRYISVRAINDTSWAYRKWNGSGYTEDTLKISLYVGTIGDIISNGWRSLTIAPAAVTDSKLSTGINANKIADGSVSSTEFQYINSVTSNVQTQLNNKLDSVKIVSGVLYDYHNGTSTSRGSVGSNGSINDFRQLKFTIGVSAYAPSAGDSILIYPSYVGKKLIIFREHEHISDSNAAYGYVRMGDTIKFTPHFYANEEFVIHAYPDSNWTTDVLSAPSGYDADAIAYFNAITGAGGSLTTPQKDAINAFILGEKADTLFSSLYDGMYVTCLGSAAASKINMVDPVDADASYRLTFNNSATFATTGLTTNGSNQTISTHFIPGAGGIKMGQNDSHIAVYQRTSTGSDNPIWGINQTGSQIYLFPKESGGAGAFKYINKSNYSFTPANAKGFWMTRRNATNIILDKDGTNVVNSLDNGNGETFSTTYDLVFNGWNNNGTPALSHAAEIGFISFGKYMTDTQATNHKNRVVTLLTALGAN